ncbi:HNH endonuclease [Streptomyces sp. NPDC051954]|uniref:HNH endonuclease n=1 Tax=Streptomyces sp. NPDC051954 TaxID=3155524 RepID=UPI00344A90ED
MTTFPAGERTHRVDTALSQAARLCRYAPITEIHVERVAFDTHAMSAGRPLTQTEYRQGTLAGTEARAYLHAKWNSACAYCDATGVPLNIDHLRPRSRGGSNRISNLVLACAPCNQAKNNARVEVFLAHRPERLAAILQQVKTPLGRTRQTSARLVGQPYEVEPRRYGAGEDPHPGRAVRRTSGS